MSKTKTPFLSLGAQGSVGKSITAQKRGSVSLLRVKPLPADPYSLPQAYQRWLYEDYAYLWRQQSTATQAEYRSAGVRYHLTGFQYWMKYQLKNLPDIAAWYKCDINTQPTTPDSSRNSNTAIVTGASPIAGIIDQAFNFDGLNDFLRAPDSPSLRVTSSLTIEFWEYIPVNYIVTGCVLTKGQLTAYTIQCLNATARNRFLIKTAGGSDNFNSTPSLPLASWFHVLYTYDGVTMKEYLNGSIWTQKVHAFPGLILTNADPLDIALRSGVPNYCKCYLDNIIIYNRVLDTTEILRHSLRRYPV